MRKKRWPELQYRNTCKIRLDSGLPKELLGVRCNLLQQVTRGWASPMWKISTFGEGVNDRDLEVHPDHLFKIHASRDDFENLKDGSWVEGVILNCFMEIMSQNMGWG